MEKEEKDIRFVARFYRENRLDTTQAWQKLGIGKQRNNSILLYRLITIACRFFYPKKKVYILMAVSRNVFSALLI